MPRFEPFAAVRYAPTHPLARVTAPPYDVLSPADRASLAGSHPHNVVKIDVPVESDGDDRYATAATLLNSWIERGVLRHDAGAAYYRYSMTFVDEAGVTHVTRGVFGALAVLDIGEGDVLPHEQTTPKDKTDRLDLTQATNANLSAVWGLSMATGVGSAIAGAPAERLAEFTDAAGVEHLLERISDSTAIDALRRLIESRPVVIADGHHRYEIARVHRRQLGPGTGSHDFTLTFVVELAADQLFIQAIHRLITGLPAGFDLPDHLDAFFDAEPAGLVSASITSEMDRRGALCLVAPDGTGTLLTPRPAAFAETRDLDSMRVVHALEGVDHTLTYQHGVDRATTAVVDGRAQFALLIRPVPIAEIERTANEGLLMPPKSTFFAPKPKTGIVFRSL